MIWLGIVVWFERRYGDGWESGIVLDASPLAFYTPIFRIKQVLSVSPSTQSRIKTGVWAKRAWSHQACVNQKAAILGWRGSRELETRLWSWFETLSLASTARG